jgi:hypothetical protein
MKIDPSNHGWMTSPETLTVFAALGEARFVGGARRASRDKEKRRRRREN